MLKKLMALTVISLLITGLAGCSPEVGSEKWCEMMKDKPKGDWTANEAADYTKHCLFPTNGN